ncbi:class I SAM-dependent methyltransferase [Dactylosporangium sp. NPDC050588]|uniref:class I SAM-dependent methyltransferase n=1 Tax=Dactylosporangium sp. NPDC050588 TaxID=3157211 RepID=UPI0033C78AE9
MGNPAGDPAYALERSQEEYERLGRQALFLHGTTERLLRDAGLRPGMRVLDVGSGAGDVALLAAGIVGPQGTVVGVDVDAAALGVARGRAEALGLSNIEFVEGDLDTADAGTGFDAAVGRLVLMYRTDPVAALRAVAARVRSGGIIAFQELDLDPAIAARSLPEASLWNDTGRLTTEAFRRAGMQVRMGRQLFSAYTAAGLPEPTMRDEALIGGGPGFGGYAWLAGVTRALAPLMQKLGLDLPGDLDTLADRLRTDAVTNGTVVWTPSLVGAHATKP